MAALLLGYGVGPDRRSPTAGFTPAAHTSPPSTSGRPSALDADATRRLAGSEADARAYLLLRPYLKRAVRVEITDPADPTPYWLLSTRHPDRAGQAVDRHPAGEPDRVTCLLGVQGHGI